MHYSVNQTFKLGLALMLCTTMTCTRGQIRVDSPVTKNRGESVQNEIQLPSFWELRWGDRNILPIEQKQLHALFADNPELHRILTGSSPLSSGRGEHIKRFQRAIMFLGYDLPLYGADGSIGKETRLAIGEFQEDNALTKSESIDTQTLRKVNEKIMNYDSKQILEGESIPKYPEYQNLFQDGLLEITIAIGFDDKGSQLVRESKKITQYLDAHYIAIDVEAVETVYSKIEKNFGSIIDRPLYKYGGQYYIRPNDIVYKNKSIKVLIRFLEAVTAQTTMRNIFLEAMMRSDVAIYSGHGRYGTGPDFFQKTATDGKIPINLNPELRGAEAQNYYKKYPVRELPITYMDRNRKYKLWFFDGCNTAQYLGALRSENDVSSRKTDVVGWGQEIAISTTKEDVVNFMESVIRQSSVQDIIKELNHINGIKNELRGVHGSGFGGNPSQP